MELLSLISSCSSSSSHIHSILLISVTTLAITLFLSTFPNPPPQQLLISSARELIANVGSARVFFACNVIIALLLCGSKSRATSDRDGDMLASMDNMDVKKVKAREEEQEEDQEHAMRFDDNDGNGDDDGDHDDEELRRRVEEFIAKVSKGWKEEKEREIYVCEFIQSCV